MRFWNFTNKAQFVRKSFLFGLIFAIILIGCKEDKDEELPSVEIVFPSENSFIQIPDTIEIFAKANDNNVVSQIKTKLLNQNFVGILPEVIRSFNSNEVEFLVDYPMDDLSILSGTYFLKVEASDGINVASDFVQLNLNEAPLERENLFIISENNAEVVVYNSYELNSLTQFVSYSSGLSSTAVSSYSGFLFTAGTVTGNLSAIADDPIEIAWEVENNSSTGGSYFFDMDFDSQRKLIYVSTSESDVRGYNHSGMLASVVNIPANNVAKTIHNFEELIIVEVENVTGTNRYLAVYNKSSGFQLSLIGLNFDVNTINTIDNSRVLVSGNESDNGVLAIFNVFNNSLDFGNGLFENQTISDVVRLDNNNFFVASDNDLYLYQLSSNNPIVFASGFNADFLNIDLANSLLFASTGSTITIFDIVSGQVVNTLEAPSQIDAIEVLYNR